MIFLSFQHLPLNLPHLFLFSVEIQRQREVMEIGRKGFEELDGTPQPASCAYHM